LDGQTHNATYWVAGKIRCHYWRKWQLRQVCAMEPEVLMRQLLLELVMRIGLTNLLRQAFFNASKLPFVTECRPLPAVEVAVQYR
jgi:hypothetical protein